MRQLIQHLGSGRTELVDVPAPGPRRGRLLVRATRSLLETDLLRLEAKQGPGAPPYEEVAARRKAFREGKLIEAGAPWGVQAVDANGTAGPRLVEFR